MQNWLKVDKFIEKNNWPQALHVWGTMLKTYYKLQLKLKTTDELKVALQTIWKELTQQHINKVW